ncbi:MAG: hypothetical protein NTV31_00200 [Bacteroidia bacterium]|nr:hypothetical protein [Bacteroidia bacterium]
MKRTLTYCILISLILITPFIYSDNLYNGLISAKQIWFYGAMALLILAFGIYLLFCRNKVSFSLNIIDIALLVFYTYFFIRAVFILTTVYSDTTHRGKMIPPLFELDFSNNFF